MQTLDGVKPERGPMKVWGRLLFLQSFFERSGEDRPVSLVRESLEDSLWSSCFSDLDSCSDKKKFQALDVLVGIIHPDNEVSVAFSRLDPPDAVVP